MLTGCLINFSVQAGTWIFAPGFLHFLGISSHWGAQEADDSTTVHYSNMGIEWARSTDAADCFRSFLPDSVLKLYA
jgi:hypothetical protein